MNKIQIVNWLLTRACNLRCEYCRIVKNYINQPKEYLPMKHYIQNEMDTETVITGLENLKKHNPECFHIFYGGEPLLREDLSKIINYCNNNNIHYTIISNNTDKVQPAMKKLLDNVSYIEGFTASIDPLIYEHENKNSDIFKKSFRGFQKLIDYSSQIKDVVAEITVTNQNQKYLYKLVRDLTEKGINSDITFVDISKSSYYDFSDVEDENILVRKSLELEKIITKIIDEKLNVHMRETLLPKIYDTLPSEYNCNLNKDFHNMTIDADGSIRLCLRIRGVITPFNFNINNIFIFDGILDENINKSIDVDKRNYCLKCQWSCPMMSEMISNEEENSNNLIHDEIRK